MIDEKVFKKVVLEIEQDWQLSGLSDGLYYEFALQALYRYFDEIKKAQNDQKQP